MAVYDDAEKWPEPGLVEHKINIRRLGVGGYREIEILTPEEKFAITIARSL